MGEHRGYRIRLRGDRWLAEVRRPDKAGYYAKTFDGKRQASDWAIAEMAAVRSGARKSASASMSQTGTLAMTDAYCTYLRGRNRSPSHLKYVKRLGHALATHVPDMGAPDVPRTIATWLDNQHQVRRHPGQPVSMATRNKYLAVIRALCRFAMRRDLLDRDPTRMCDMASLPEKIKPQFTIGELRACLAQTHYKTQRGMRKGMPKKPDPYHLLFAIMTYTGLRYQEAACLRWEDIDFQGNVILVRLESGARIKRERERIVPIQPELLAILDAQRQPGGHLFPGRRHNTSRGFRAFLKRAGLQDDDRSPHSCRHTYAGLMTATGVPTALLGAYLGHTNASTTQGYTKLAARYVTAVDGWPRGRFLLTAIG